MLLGALLALRLVTPEEGISGFSNPATITVGAMFVLSAALRKTGALAVYFIPKFWPFYSPPAQ